MLGLSDSVWKFSQTWVWLSIVIYVLAIGLSHGVLMPAVKRMGVLMHEMAAGPPPVGGPPPQAAEMASIGQKLGVVGPDPRPLDDRGALPHGVQAGRSVARRSRTVRVR